MGGQFTRVIANGTVAVPYGVFRAHVVIAGERLISQRSARIAGVYLRKGSLLVGSDADLVRWDLSHPWVIDSASQQFSKNPWSPFGGREIRARVVRTLLRGQAVHADGEVRVGAGSGRFLSGQDDYSLAGLAPAGRGTRQ